MSDGLVQNLRSYPHASRSLRDEAANRIEALEQTIWTMHGEAHEHIKRIESLEGAYQSILKSAGSDIKQRDERIEALETKLEGAAAFNKWANERAKKLETALRFTLEADPSIWDIKERTRAALQAGE